MFLGYPFDYKGYKILDLETNSISITQNVIFHENIFPFLDSQSSAFDFFSHIVLPAPIPFVPTSSEHDHASHIPSASHPSPVVPEVSETVVSETALVPCHDERPRRQTKTPSYLSDYHCALLCSDSSSIPIHHSTPYPLSSFLSYKCLSPPYYKFLLSFPVETEPKTLFEAMNYDRWRCAANDELNAIELNKTWTVVSLPPG